MTSLFPEGQDRHIRPTGGLGSEGGFSRVELPEEEESYEQNPMRYT